MTKQGAVTVVSDKVDSLKSSSSITANLKRLRSSSESDSELPPSLRSRLAKKASLKRQKTVNVNQDKGKSKESGADSALFVEDNDFETPKVKRNAEKRSGSDLSDDQGVCSRMSTCEQLGSSTSVEKQLSYKRRKASTANITSEASLKSHASKPVKKKLKKRQVTTSIKATSDILEG